MRIAGDFAGMNVPVRTPSSPLILILQVHVRAIVWLHVAQSHHAQNHALSDHAHKTMTATEKRKHQI